MSPSFIRDQLFKPFVSTKSGGFGIGAFESREIARSMGGHLEVWSREGQGTRFTVHLPLAAMSGDQRSEEHTSELQSLMRISYAVFCLKKKKNIMNKEYNTIIK